MKVIFSLLCATALLLGGSFGNPSLNITLPTGRSNVYPDTFAVHWSLLGPLKHLKTQKNLPVVDLELNDLFDEITFQKSTGDSIITVPPIQKESVNLKICLNNNVYHCSYEFALRKTKENAEIEALRSKVLTSPTVENYTLLIDAFEKNTCYVNSIHMLSKLAKVDSIAGQKAWQEYVKRHRYDYEGNRVER